MKLKLPFTDRGLHWTTVTSEKVLLAIIGIATCIAAAQYLYMMYETREIPIIIAITALCRLIIMQGKEMDALMLLGEAGAILILAVAAYVMSLKDKVSLEKKEQFKDDKSPEI